MQLHRHPASPDSPAERIEVIATRIDGRRLSLVFSVVGDIAAMRLPPMTSPRRADGLWQHTCFEAFLRSRSQNAYVELNFASSGRWAAYRLDGYRTGIRSADIPEPNIASEATPAAFGLVAGIDLGPISELATNETWLAGLSAVIEAADGSLSYWALAHPPGDKPDFHDPACFALELPAATGR